MTEAPALFRRELSGLRPIGDIANEVMRKIKVGDTVRVEVKRPRSLPRHRLWWGILQLVADNLDGVTAEKLHQLVKLRIGYVDLIKTTKGVYEIPQSTSFDAMSEETFADFLDKGLAFLCTEALPGLGKDDLLREVNEILEGRS